MPPFPPISSTATDVPAVPDLPVRQTRYLVFSVVLLCFAGVSIWRLTLGDLPSFGPPWQNHFPCMAFICLVLIVVFGRRAAFEILGACACQLPVPRRGYVYGVLTAAAAGGAATFFHLKEKLMAEDPWMHVFEALALFFLGIAHLWLWKRGHSKNLTVPCS